MSIVTDAVLPALTNVATNGYVVATMMLYASVALLGPRIMRNIVDAEQAGLENADLDKRVQFYGLGSVDHAADELGSTGWNESAALRASGWEDARGNGDYLVDHDLVGGVNRFDIAPHVGADDGEIDADSDDYDYEDEEKEARKWIL